MLRLNIMKMILPALLLLTLVLGACSSSIPAAETIPAPPTKTPSPVIETLTHLAPTIQISTISPSPTSTLTPSPTSTFVFMHLDQSIVDMPIKTPSHTQCGSASIQRVFAIGYVVYDAIQTLDPIAMGFAETIDQECTDSDGKILTYASSIWFYIGNKVVANLKDYETLGSWIVDVINLLDTIPRDEYTRYAQPTNVIFMFFAGNSEPLEVRVSIEEYWAKADGKSGTEIFLMFYEEPQQSPIFTQSP